MDQMFQAFLFDEVQAFTKSLSKSDRGKIFAAITTLQTGDSRSVHVKTLRGPIRELIIKQYRLIFFTAHHTLYFASAFVKKSQKTPRREIDRVENIYKQAT